MGWLDEFFTSPREREGQRMFGAQTGQYDEAIQSILGEKSQLGGIHTIDDLNAQFGLPRDASGIFTPQRRNLATRLGRARASMAERVGDRSANPESLFLPLEGEYANASANLDSAEAQANLGLKTDAARMLEDVYGRQDEFNRGKRIDRLNALNLKGNAIADYLGSLSGGSTFDDILGLGGTFASVYNALRSKN